MDVGRYSCHTGGVFLRSRCFCPSISCDQTFKSVLQQRSDNLKAQKDHREIFVSSQSSALALAPPAAYRPLGTVLNNMDTWIRKQEKPPKH